MSDPGQPQDGGILDDAAAMKRSDPAGMVGLVAEFPDQVEEAWRISRDVDLPWEALRSVAVLGMGGSAIGGDLVRGIWSDRLEVPLEVVRGYELPAWAGQETLVIASSKSGGTEETLSALETALERRCPVVVVTTGGPLRRVAEQAGLPLATFPSSGTPRSSVGYSMGLLAGILERAGVLDLDETEIAAGAQAARGMASRCKPDVPTGENPAKQLAWSLVDRLTVVEAGDFLAPVARRWKAQLNENGKSAAAFEELPEATHNTVVGYEQPESLRDHLFVVFLSSDLGHPRNALRARLIGDVLDTAQISHQSVSGTGDSKLGQALSMIVMGDYVSVYLAFTYAVDPSPVAVIDHIKEQLARADQAAAD
ncbi:MAG: bifunctional phosphoglucose/phosphomannose isomerase [Chloroflexota bacterium]